MRPQQLIPQPDFIPEVESLPELTGCRIGVTGASGVLGGVLMERLAPLPVTVHPFLGDIVDENTVDVWVRDTQPDLVFHLAAMVPTTAVQVDPTLAMKVNALGTLNLASAVARLQPAAWLFLASSSHVYASTSSRRALTENSPLGGSTAYGATKLAAELMARPVLAEAGVACSVGRIFSLTHRNQRPPYLVPTLLEEIDKRAPGSDCRLTNARAVRDFLDAETVVDVLLLLAVARTSGVVNIGSGHPVSIQELASHLARNRGRSINFLPGPDEDDSYLVADVTLLRTLVAIQ